MKIIIKFFELITLFVFLISVLIAGIGGYGLYFSP